MMTQRSDRLKDEGYLLCVADGRMDPDYNSQLNEDIRISSCAYEERVPINILVAP